MADRPRRIIEVGVVTSTKMPKTIKVLVERRRQHPRYKKFLRRRTVYFAHDEAEVAKQGDRVEIVETRPLSKRKRWRLLRVLPAPAAGAAAAAESRAQEAPPSEPPPVDESAEQPSAAPPQGVSEER